MTFVPPSWADRTSSPVKDFRRQPMLTCNAWSWGTLGQRAQPYEGLILAGVCSPSNQEERAGLAYIQLKDRQQRPHRAAVPLSDIRVFHDGQPCSQRRQVQCPWPAGAVAHSHADGQLFRQWQVHADHLVGGTVPTHHDAAAGQHLGLLQSHAAGLQGDGLPGPRPCAAAGQHTALHWGTDHGAWDSSHHGQHAGHTAWWAFGSHAYPITMTHPSFTWSTTFSTRTPATGLSASTPHTSSCPRTLGTCHRPPTLTSKCALVAMGSW